MDIMAMELLVASAAPPLPPRSLRRRLIRKTCVSQAAGTAPEAPGAAPRTKRAATRKATAETSVSSLTRMGNFEIKEQHDQYIIVRGGLDVEMLQKLECFLRRKRPRAAKMKNEGAGDSDDERKARYEDRDSLVSWFRSHDECAWLHERLVAVVREVGNVAWPILKVRANGELDCDFEQTQYSVYGPDQHFQAWHQDAFEEGHDLEDGRQITIVAMLTDSSSYAGGQFQVKLPALSGEKGRKLLRKLPLDAGDFIVFPAKKLVHRVLKVETGIRKTLVFWANDPLSCIYGKKEAEKKVAPAKRQKVA